MRSEAIPSAPDPEPVPSVAAEGESGVVTTEVELFVLDYVRTRLPFLVAGDESLFSRLQHLRPIDHKTVFTVFYRQERKGRLFNFRQGRDPKYRFIFPEIQTKLSKNKNARDRDQGCSDTCRWKPW